MFAFVSLVLVLAPCQLEVDIPKAHWVRAFGSDSDPTSINGRAKLSELPSLQQHLLPKTHVEFRLWMAAALSGLTGYRFRFDGQKWMAWKLEPAWRDRKDLQDRKFVTPLGAPVMGWRDFWKSMEQERIFSLPDFESLPVKKTSALDGWSFIVEFQKAGKYRAYCYANPDAQAKDIKEVQNVMQIMAILKRAFPSAEARQ